MADLSFISASGNLGVRWDENSKLISAFYLDLTNVTEKEYIDYMRRVGLMLKEKNSGKLLLDISKMKKFSIGLRAAGVNNIKTLVIDPAPYLLLAIIKSTSSFENIATETALKMARPLSKKFIDGKMFSAEAEALEWLKNYNV
jgi:hypothetical protein